MIKSSQILKIYGTAFQEMTKSLLKAADLAALIRKKQEQTGEELCIGIKPNLVCPTPADYGATTHPEIVAGIIEYLRENGFSNILIAESSWVGDRTSEAYEYCGYRTLCEKYGVPFVDVQKEKSHPVDCAGIELNIADVADRIGFLINVPVMKGHCQTRVTCALKNMKGLIPSSEKRRFHQMGLHKPIGHLAAALKQDFIVVDHICGDLDFEEGGNPVIRNCIMAATDPVLTDSYVCHLMGYTADDVPYIRIAEEVGAGTADLDTLEVVHLGGSAQDAVHPGGVYHDARPDGAASGETDLPASGNPLSLLDEEELPREHRVLSVRYAVDEVDSCSACYASLVPALLRLEEEGLLKELKEKIAIGQGHQGRRGALGVGRCTKDYDFCVMGCPPDEEKIYQELKKYIETGRAG